MKTIRCIIIAALILCCFNLSAQNDIPEMTKEFRVSLQKTPTGKGDLPMEKEYTISLVMNLSDINNFSKIHLKVFRPIPEETIIQTEISLSGENNLPQGVSYTVNGNSVTVNIGNHVAAKTDYEIFLEDTLGNLSMGGIVE